MTISAQIDAANKLVTVSITETITAQEMLDYIITTDQLPPDAPMDTIVIINPLTHVQLNSMDIDLAVALSDRQNPTQQPYRLALVADGEIAYELSRLYQAYSALTPSITQVF